MAALIIVVSVMNGFNRSLRDRHLKAEPHLVVTSPKEATKEWFDQLERLIQDQWAAEVVEVSPFDQQDVVIRTVDGFFSGAVMKGLRRQAIENWVKRAEERRDRELEVSFPESQEVLLGADLAGGLRVVAGEKVVVISPESLLLPPGEAPPMLSLLVRGSFQSELGDVDGKLILYDRDLTLKELHKNASRVSGVEIRLVDGEKYQPIQDQLKSRGYDVQSWPERNASLFFALRMEKLAMTTFLGLSALITSFSILTVLVLLVTQKRREIGILKAMGLDSRETQKTFTLVGIWLSSVGLVGGLVLGVGVCFFLDHFKVDILPTIYYDRTIPAEVHPVMITIIVVIAAIIAGLGSYFPALLSSRGTAADNLRRG